MPTKTPANQVAEIVSKVCDALEGGAKSVTEACTMADVPETSVYRFVDNPEKYGLDDELLGRYTRARYGILDACANRIRDLAAIVEGMDGDDQVKVSRAKLRVESEKWLLARLMPKTLGDKQQVDHKSSDGTMTPRAALTPEVAAALNKKLEDEF